MHTHPLPPHTQISNVLNLENIRERYLNIIILESIKVV